MHSDAASQGGGWWQVWRGLRFAVRTAFVPLLDVQSVASRSPGAPKAFSEPSSLSSSRIRSEVAQ